MTESNTTQKPRVFRWRLTWLAVMVVILGAVMPWARPVYHVGRAYWRDRDERHPLPPGQVDDASRMNRTVVAQVVDVSVDPALAEAQLKSLLDRARREKLRVSIAGARHTMGGHTIYPGGIALNMLPFNRMSLDEKGGILSVGAGALWSQILPYVDAKGWSVSVMQANSSFSVGGSLSANCHGWTAGRPPIASTVQSFRLLRADGQIIRCSKQENAELFSLVLGGYGLFGVILDAELRLTRNECYRRERLIMSADQLAEQFRRRVVDDRDTAMAFGRLSVASSSFLDQAILNVFQRADPPDGILPALRESQPSALVRAVYRGSEGSDYGKELRWQAELRNDENPSDGIFTRNSLLNEDAAWFENRSDATTDILQEFFVSVTNFDAFMSQARLILREGGVDLMNLTIRDVRRDDVSFLRYADKDMMALVMLFAQPRTSEADTAMQVMTLRLIDAAIEADGRYYLPYRLHATPEQLRKCYPQIDRFFELKRRYDPDEIFQNEFYRKYGPRNPNTQPVSR